MYIYQILAVQNRAEGCWVLFAHQSGSMLAIPAPRSSQHTRRKAKQLKSSSVRKGTQRVGTSTVPKVTGSGKLVA